MSSSEESPPQQQRPKGKGKAKAAPRSRPQQPEVSEEEEEFSTQRAAAPKGKGKRPAPARNGRRSQPESDEDDEQTRAKRASNGKGRRISGHSSRTESEEEGVGSEDSDPNAAAAAPRRRSAKGKKPATMRQRQEAADSDEEEANGENGNVNNAASDDEEGTQFHFTQEEAPQERWAASQRPGGAAVNEKERVSADKLQRDTLTELVGRMMRFLLMKGARYEPITKAQMRAEVFSSETEKKLKVFNVVLDQANQRLKATLGLGLYQAPPNKPWAVKDTWYLLNECSESRHCTDIAKNAEAPSRGLLMVVAGLIYCQPPKKLYESELFRKLHQLDIAIPPPNGGSGDGKGKGRAKPSVTSGSVNVAGLGDVVALLAAFVKQQYLKKEREQNPDGEPVDCYKLGPRLYLEVGRRNIVRFVAESIGETPDKHALDSISDEEGEPAQKTGNGNEEEGDGGYGGAAADDAEEEL